MKLSDLTEKCEPLFLALLRVVASLVMIEHGTQTIIGFPPNVANIPYSLLGYIAAWMQLIGGVPLILGLFSRPIAFIFAGELAFAYFLRHAPRGFFPANNGGEVAALLCFIFLYISAAGPGLFSLKKARKPA